MFENQAQIIIIIVLTVILAIMVFIFIFLLSEQSMCTNNISPPSDLTISNTVNNVSLNWTLSNQKVDGYNINVYTINDNNTQSSQNVLYNVGNPPVNVPIIAGNNYNFNVVGFINQGDVICTSATSNTVSYNSSQSIDENYIISSNYMNPSFVSTKQTPTVTTYNNNSGNNNNTIDLIKCYNRQFRTKNQFTKNYQVCFDNNNNNNNNNTVYIVDNDNSDTNNLLKYSSYSTWIYDNLNMLRSGSNDEICLISNGVNNPVVLDECNNPSYNDNNKKWNLINVDGGSKICLMNNNKMCMTSNGSTLLLQNSSANNQNSQKFILTMRPDNFSPFTITSTNSNNQLLYMLVEGTQLAMSTENTLENNAGLFIFSMTGNIIPLSNLNLAITGNTTANTVNLSNYLLDNNSRWLYNGTNIALNGTNYYMTYSNNNKYVYLSSNQPSSFKINYIS